MNITLPVKIALCGIISVAAWVALASNDSQQTASFNTDAKSVATIQHDDQVVHSDYEADLIQDSQIQLCQGYVQAGGQSCGCSNCVAAASGYGGGGGFGYGGGGGFGYGGGAAATGTSQRFGSTLPTRAYQGVNQNTQFPFGEAKWRHQSNVPFEQFAYGEYIGPHRSPHVPEYRLRVDDQLEFVYLRTRERSLEPYRLYVGDQITISSTIDPTLDQPGAGGLTPGLTIRSDGMISLSLIGQVRAAGKTVEDLQRELNDRYVEFVKNPSIVVQVIQGNTPLQDLLAAVDARGGTGGQVRAVTVSPDGTVQLPGIGSVPAIGLSIDEIAREVNARYRLRQGGIEVTPILVERAPRFIYVLGEVAQPGQFELVGPTSVLQALALAEGELIGGNLRQVIVFRRDQNWRLTATRLDLNGAVLGKRPFPSDEIWLRDSDIVLVPEKPIQRFSDAVNLYLAQTLYAIFPQQGVAFDFDGFTSL